MLSVPRGHSVDTILAMITISDENWCAATVEYVLRQERVPGRGFLKVCVKHQIDCPIDLKLSRIFAINNLMYESVNKLIGTDVAIKNKTKKKFCNFFIYLDLFFNFNENGIKIIAVRQIHLRICSKLH